MSAPPAWGLSLVLLCLAVPARGQVYAEELRVTGAWPDVEPAVGAGIGLDRALDPPLAARLRLGGLLAHEPWILGLGVSGELGGLAGRGLGVALAVDHFGGAWASAALSRVQGSTWMTRAALGFTLAGIEWQHRHDASAADAVMLLLRIPLGKWWFLLARPDAPSAPRGGTRLPSPSGQACRVPSPRVGSSAPPEPGGSGPPLRVLV